MRAWLPFVFLLLLGLARPAAAQYSMTTWTTADGLPQSTVVEVAQTPDGFLWITTLGGLARFDGRTFRTFDTTTNPELPHSRFAWLSVDDAGQLWVTLQTGELLRFVDGRFDLVGMAERARMMGGDLTIKSAPGRGTTITILVPRSAGQTGQQGGGHAGAGTLDEPRE